MVSPVNANFNTAQIQHPQAFLGGYSYEPQQQGYLTSGVTAPPELKSDTVEISSAKDNIETQQKKGMSKGAKVGIGLGITALAGIGIYIATKGKGKINLNANQENKIKKLIADGKLDEKHAEIFKSIEHLEGDDFIKEAYKRIAESMGYDRLTRPVLEITSKNSSGGTKVRSIKIDKLGFATKEKQVCAIRHELEHFRQKDIMYRALGKDATLDSMVEPKINKLKYNEQYCIEKLGKKYSELTHEELQSYRSKLRTEFDNSDNFDRLNLLLETKGKITEGTAEYAEAEKILEAYKKYLAPTAVINEPLTSDLLKKLKIENPKVYNSIKEVYDQRYHNSYLEIEARSVENKIGEMYRHFCEAIKN